jgi:predicted ATP-grasp superfamily ATP-dependent carboligase|tara:strand:+ start:1164 stop:1382 length:219 start_codon:yes stop_codon:yes gene_type:complete
MKESKLLEMQNKVEALGSALTRVINEMTNLKDLSIGTMELVKKLPDYDKALEKLKEQYKKKKDESIQTKDSV